MTERRNPLEDLINCKHENFNEEGSDYHERDRCLDCGATREINTYAGPGEWKLPKLVRAALKGK